MRRGALHYILFGAALGLGVPLVFRLASTALESYTEVPDAMWTVFDYAQLMLWPTPLLMVPVEEPGAPRSEEHTSELQSQSNLVCRLLLEKKKKYEALQVAAPRICCALR